MKIFRILLFVLSVTFTSNVFSQSVYTTKTGEKYHKENCHYLKSSKYEITLERAKELGYDACSVCKPSSGNIKNKLTSITNSTGNSNQSTANTTKSTATQCTGKTKTGARCKRMTKSADGTCYQH